MAKQLLPPPPGNITDTYQWRDWMTKAATAIVGTVDLTQDVSGVLSVGQGGTGAANPTTARSNLGLGSIATQNSNNVSITGGNIAGNVSGTLSGTFSGTLTSISNSTDTTASSGTNGGLPSQVAGYVIINISGVDYKLPFYNM